MIRNPIIQREFIGLLRRWQTLAVQLVWLAALAAVVLLRWPASSRVNLSGQQAADVLRLFGYTLLAGLMILAPAFPAGTLVSERRSGTLSLLLNSPLSPAAVYWGKLAGVMGVPLLLLVLSIPPAVACYTMGGVSVTHELLPLYGVLACVALQSTALGLYVSLRAATVEAALRTTYAALFVIGILVLIPPLFIHADTPGLGQPVAWVASLSPIPAVVHALGQRQISGGQSGVGHVISHYAIASLLMSVILAIATIRRLAGRLFDRPRASGKMTDDRSTGVKVWRRVMYLWFFDPQRRSGLTGPWSNPVMVKEFRASRFGRSHWMMRLIGGCLIVSLGLMLAASWGSMSFTSNTLGEIIVLLQVSLIILIAPTLSAGLISSEIQTGSWQILQMTPLTPVTIVLGKLLSAARTLLLILLATLPGYAVMLIINPNQKRRVVLALVCLIVIAVVSVLVSAAVSSLFRRTATATAVAYGVLVALCGGGLLAWAGRGDIFSTAVVRFCLRTDPLAAALGAVRAPGFTHYALLPWNWWFMGGVGAAALLVLVWRTGELTRAR